MGQDNEPVTYEVSVDITLEQNLPLDTDAWFQQNTRTCCLSISALAAFGSSSFQPLPAWLSLSWAVEQAPIGSELTAKHMLTVSAQPGRAAVGNHTIRVLATDSSLPELPPAFMDINLRMIGQGPTIVGIFPIVEVEDKQPLLFVLPGGVIQLNKPYGRLRFTAEQQGGEPLPAWLGMHPDGTLKGTPQEGMDASYNLTITGADDDGLANSTSIMLYVRAPCPVGLYRHFRIRISATNDGNWYDTSDWGWSAGRSAICSIFWDAAQPDAASFPSPASGKTYNTSGSTYRVNSGWVGTRDAAPITAFQQLADVGCDVSSPFHGGNAWLVCPHWVLVPTHTRYRLQHPV